MTFVIFQYLIQDLVFSIVFIAMVINHFVANSYLKWRAELYELIARIIATGEFKSRLADSSSVLPTDLKRKD